jgi:arginase
MEVELIAVPYDRGQARAGVGLGPERILQELGRPAAAVVELPEGRRTEIMAWFELAGLLAGRVAEAVGRGRFPLALAGNCGTAGLGVPSGLAAARLGVVWFDAHGDFNTPETTASGFIDGMGLAVLTGAGWRALRETIPGYRVVPEEAVLLVGVRDLDEREQARVAASPVALVGPERVRAEGAAALSAPLAALRERVDGVYLHLDLDALDPSEGKANELAVDGGLSLTDVEAAIFEIGRSVAILGAGIASYDPTGDDGRIARAGARLARLIEQVAAEVPSPPGPPPSGYPARPR